MHDSPRDCQRNAWLCAVLRQVEHERYFPYLYGPTLPIDPLPSAYDLPRGDHFLLELSAKFGERVVDGLRPPTMRGDDAAPHDPDDLRSDDGSDGAVDPCSHSDGSDDGDAIAAATLGHSPALP